MKVYQTLKSGMKKRDRAVALGLFDGVHIGHQKVIAAAVALAPEQETAVLTFTTKKHRPNRKAAQKDILTPEDRLKRLSLLPVKTVFMPDFEDFREYNARQFVDEILHDSLCAKTVCCGDDFRFGRDASGDAKQLMELCRERDIAVEIVPSAMDHGVPVSSTRIREYLLGGDIQSANRLLGYHYFIEQKVVYGQQLGKKVFGVPTINQRLCPAVCIPRFGVYASLTEWNEKRYPSVTNIGIKPTIEENREPLAETHLIGFHTDVYGERLKVELYDFVRPEQRFDNMDQLKATITRDVETAAKYFHDRDLEGYQLG